MKHFAGVIGRDDGHRNPPKIHCIFEIREKKRQEKCSRNGGEKVHVKTDP